MIDLSSDINRNMSSLPHKKTRKHGYHVPPEPGGTWLYIDGVVTTGGAGNSARCVARKFAEVLATSGIRIGRHWYEDVESWYIWVPSQESK